MPEFGSIPINETVAKRFAASIEVSGPDECWPWIEYRDKDGYGRFIYQVEHQRCHRPATHGVLFLDGRPRSDKGQIALHSCDNPPCCNPAHLSWGSKAKNVEERDERGRGTNGERHGMTSLTEHDVRAIRADTRRTGIVAKEWGISDSSVFKIRKRTSWVHLD